MDATQSYGAVLRIAWPKSVRGSCETAKGKVAPSAFSFFVILPAPSSVSRLPLFTRRVSVMTGFGEAEGAGEDRLARGGSLKNAPRRVLGARLHRPRPLCVEGQ
jgi:hypothetical protein